MLITYGGSGKGNVFGLGESGPLLPLKTQVLVFLLSNTQTLFSTTASTHFQVLYTEAVRLTSRILRNWFTALKWRELKCCFWRESSKTKNYHFIQVTECVSSDCLSHRQNGWARQVYCSFKNRWWAHQGIWEEKAQKLEQVSDFYKRAIFAIIVDTKPSVHWLISITFLNVVCCLLIKCLHPMIFFAKLLIQTLKTYYITLLLSFFVFFYLFLN